MNFYPPHEPMEVVLLDTQPPKIIINFDALLEMKAYIENCEYEIGWLGRVQEHDGTLFITETYLFDQEVNETTTEISPEGLQAFAEELMQEADGVQKWNEVRVWGHSHVYMSTQPSRQDDRQMDEFSRGGHPYVIRLIANKKGELRLDYFDFKQNVIFLNVPWDVEYAPELKEYLRRIKELEDSFKAYHDRVFEQVQEKVKPEIRLLVKQKAYERILPWDEPFENDVFPPQFSKEG